MSPFPPCLPMRSVGVAITELSKDGVDEAIWVSLFKKILGLRGLLCTLRPTLQRLTAEGGKLLFEVMDGRYDDWVTTSPEKKYSLDQIIGGARPRDWLSPPLDKCKDGHPALYLELVQREAPHVFNWLTWRFASTAERYGRDTVRAILERSVYFSGNKELLTPILEAVYGDSGSYWASRSGGVK